MIRHRKTTSKEGKPTDNALKNGDDAESGDRGDNNIDVGDRMGRFEVATPDGPDCEKSEDGEKMDDVKEYAGDTMFDEGEPKEIFEKWSVSEEGTELECSLFKASVERFLGIILCSIWFRRSTFKLQSPI